VLNAYFLVFVVLLVYFLCANFASLCYFCKCWLKHIKINHWPLCVNKCLIIHVTYVKLTCWIFKYCLYSSRLCSFSSTPLNDNCINIDEQMYGVIEYFCLFSTFCDVLLQIKHITWVFIFWSKFCFSDAQLVCFQVFVSQ